MKRSQLRGTLWLWLIVSVAAYGQVAAPVANRVEPPNWWIGLHDPMLLITGNNLAGATVSTHTNGVKIDRVEQDNAGNHLFVWLKISPNAHSGNVPFNIRTAQGETELDFALRARSHGADIQGFSPDDVIYLIMPDRFADGDTSNDQPTQSPGTFDRAKTRAYHGGDLRGIREHLPYLKDLGVTAIWLTPIYDNDNTSPNDYHGYGAVDYYAVDEHLGILADFQALVDEAHRLGLKIVMDMVPNHVGPKHPWVKSPPDPQWFHGTPQQHLAAHSPFDSLTDPHSVPRQWRDVVEGWFANILPDLNQENPRTAEYLLDNALWWVESTGLDAFRLDTFPYVGRAFWSRYLAELKRAYPNFTEVGEVFHGDPTVTSYFAGGRQGPDGIDTNLTTVFDFPFYFAVRDVTLRDAPLQQLVSVWRRDSLFPHPELLVTFIANHDVVRYMGEPGATPDKLKMAFSLLLTTRGIPQLYYGDEIGMPGGGDPDNRRDFPGGFPGDPRNGFTAAGRTPTEQDVFSHLQKLLALRKQHAALRVGEQRHIFISNKLYAALRQAGDDRLLIVCNNSDEPAHAEFKLANTPLSDAHSLLPLFAATGATINDGRVTVDVAARTLAIYEVK
jgi:glycosidase